MKQQTAITVECLGQSGFRFQLGRQSVYIDPYLSDSVAVRHGREMQRMMPPPYLATEAPIADWILITHIHDDHCDPETLRPIWERSPAARTLGPAEVIEHLCEVGFDADRLVIADEEWVDLGSGVRLCAVPAAHTDPERDSAGRLRFLGYVIDHGSRRIYHSGDTSPHPQIFDALKTLLPLDVAFLPVNERNYYRDRRGIIGNMSIREAFQMAADLDVKTLVPVHWDLFAPNSVFREELLLLYDLLRPPFRMILNPETL